MGLSNARNYEVEIMALIHTELEFLRCGALQITQLGLLVAHDRGPTVKAAISFRLFILAHLYVCYAALLIFYTAN